MLLELTSDFPQVDAVFASVVRLACNFHSFSEEVIDTSQVQWKEERNSEVTHKRGELKFKDQPSVFKASAKFFKTLFRVLARSGVKYPEEFLEDRNFQRIYDFSS